MAVTATGLSSAITSEIEALSGSSIYDSDSVLNAIAKGCHDYILANLELTGTYSGTTNTVPPVSDPNNNDYKWAVKTYVFNGSILKAHVNSFDTPEAAFNGLKNAFSVPLSQVTFIGKDKTEKVTTSVVVTLAGFTVSMSQSDIYECGDKDSVWDIIADKVVASLHVFDVTSLTSDATSSTPGSGTVTFIALE